jgi:hypothetical protein
MELSLQRYTSYKQAPAKYANTEVDHITTGQTQNFAYNSHQIYKQKGNLPLHLQGMFVPWNSGAGLVSGVGNFVFCKDSLKGKNFQKFI